MRASGVLPDTLPTKAQPTGCCGARTTRELDRQCRKPHHRSANGLPVLSEALAYVEYRLVSEYDGEDHAILLGEVIGLGSPAPEESPLVFFQGSMRELGDTPVSRR
ncbi:flavin reductase family protein [Actinocorallia sp. B10E7]|uniref:flavin reductase family protein n=1 Tax=Actinocorallia sp. B10E7 TaxID=3153558 RepID=UPI00325C3C5A